MTQGRRKGVTVVCVLALLGTLLLCDGIIAGVLNRVVRARAQERALSRSRLMCVCRSTGNHVAPVVAAAVHV